MRRLLSLILTVAMVVLSVGACDAGKKGSGIEGKVVDGKGRPMNGVKLIAKQVQPLKGYEQFETKTGSDGTFRFNGVFPSCDYVIRPLAEKLWGQHGEVISFTIMSGPRGQTSMIGRPFEIRFTQSTTGILTDSKTDLQWVPSNGQTMNHFQAEAYVQGLGLDDGGWRLPTTIELKEFPGNMGNMRSTLNVMGNWIWSGELCSTGALYIGADGWNGGCRGRDISDSREYAYNFSRVLAVRPQK